MTTLGLNIIAGPNDNMLLKRCLISFDAKNLFDEIVIVNTSKSDSIDFVANDFDARCLKYEWQTEEYPYGNFGGARDFARKQSTTDKIMWLDTDDVLLEQHKAKLIEALEIVKDIKNKEILVWRFPYSLIFNTDGTPDMYFMRERIFDREKIHWDRPVHEMTFPFIEMVKHGTINGTFITHMPTKPQYASAMRNIAILEHEHKKDPNEIQNRYFLGRDYLLSGQPDRGIPLLADIVTEMNTGTEMLYAISMELAWYYAYKSSQPRPDIQQYKIDNLTKVESYCRLALSFSFDYAEPYVLLGDTYFYKKEVDAATRMYLTALKKEKDKGIFKTITLYGEVPCARLSLMYKLRGLWGMSLHYNKQAIRHNKTEEYIKAREGIVNIINEEMKELN